MLKTFLCTLLAIFLFTGVVHAQEANLPDPGILPNHPLYFLKNWSENIRTVFTFSDEAKAERMLHLSEKRLAEASRLFELGETELGEKTMGRYEDHFEKAMQKAQSAREKGLDTDELYEKVSEATLKHQHVLAEVYEKVPEQAKEAIQRALQEGIRGHEQSLENISQQSRERVVQQSQERIMEVEEKMQELRNQGVNIPAFNVGNREQSNEPSDDEFIAPVDMQNERPNNIPARP